MLPLQLNPETGFLESPSPNHKTFDSDKKLLFVQTAIQTAQAGKLPDVIGLCKALGISIQTFWDHYNQDPEFKLQYGEALRYCEHTLAQTMFERGKTPGGYMDRITWLRRHFPEWRETNGPNITVDFTGLKGLSTVSQQFIDAEVVDNKTNESSTKK